MNTPPGNRFPAILRFSRALHAASTLDQVLDKVRGLLTETTRYRWTYVHLRHPDGKTMEIAGWILPSAEQLRAHHALVDVSRDKLLQRVMNATEPFIVNDLRSYADADQTQVEAAGIRTAIVVPMFDGDERIGPLVVPTFADQGVVPPTEEEYDFILQIAALVGTVISRLRAQEARAQAESRLAQTEKLDALGRMAGAVAHDFNNVLLAVLANLDLAIAEVAPHPAVAYLEDALQAAQRAARLTKQLLASSRGQVLARQPVDVGVVLHAAQKLIEPTLPTGVSIEVKAQAERSLVLGDNDELERVFTNLLVNARDAVTHGGHINVELRNVHINGEFIASRDELRSGDYALLTVSDDGIGMTSETQARIFEPFFSTKGPERGTGLGLAVVLGVTKQHGGYVHVYSELGLGTTFKVYLPLADLGLGSAPSVAPRSDHIDGTESLLVVDDDEHVRRTLERILTRHGYRVRAEASAVNALAALDAQHFDLLLSDVVLGDSDGVTLVARAQERFPALQAIFVTGYARTSLSGLSAPHLVKPFPADELLGLLRRTLDRR
jgi:two-component system, cell cycle sensor histidine kinase and response regulator CckA